MFEQQSYAFEAPAEPLREGDLFYKYEVGRWKFNNRIYAILAIAAVINLAFLGVLAQTNILTARGCESPFVGRVCQVLDMAYVGAVLFGTEREMADVEYERTELGEADVVWIDQTGVPAQLEYPEGYFQVANPEQFAQQQAMLNGIPSDGFNSGGFPPITPPVQSGSSLIDTPAIAPKRNPKARPNNLPDSPFDLSDVNGDATADNDAGDAKPGNSNTNTAVKDPKVAQNNTNANSAAGSEDEAKEDKFGVFLNKRPMREQAEETIADVNANKIKLDSSFKVTVTGTLGLAKDGKTVVLKDPKPVVDKTSPVNDPEMEKLVQDWILAVGDAGWFGYLDKLKSKKIIITVEQNDTELVASVKADQPSENFAKTAASGLNGLLQIAATQVKDDEKIFLESAKVTSEGNTFVLYFVMPKPVVQEMIQRKLAEQAADAKKPNGSAMTRPNDNTAIR